jgi:hypothetical protein
MRHERIDFFDPFAWSGEPLWTRPTVINQLLNRGGRASATT